MDVGRVGIWTGQLDLQPAARAREVAAELDELGYGALWVPEAVGRDAVTHAAVLLDATDRMVVATGVANIYGRLPNVAAMAQRLLADDSGGRFLLGLGVSHAPDGRGHAQARAGTSRCPACATYLDGLDDAFIVSPAPAEDPPRVLAALGPRMLELAAARAWGALTYFVPVEHTPVAREHLGDGPMLLVEQAAVLSTDRRGGPRRRPQAHGHLPHAAQLREQPAAPRLGRRRPGRRGQRRPGRRAGGRGASPTRSRPGSPSTTRQAPTTCASRCSTPTSPPCRSSSGGRWRRRCSAAEPNDRGKAQTPRNTLGVPAVRPVNLTGRSSLRGTMVRAAAQDDTGEDDSPSTLQPPGLAADPASSPASAGPASPSASPSACVDRGQGQHRPHRPQRRRPGHHRRRPRRPPALVARARRSWPCASATFTGLRRYLAFREARWVEASLRDRLFAHLQRLHFAFHDQTQTGQLMSRANTDLQQIQAFVVMIPLTISNAVTVLAVTVILFVIDPVLTLLALGSLPFVNVLATRFSRRLFPQRHGHPARVGRAGGRGRGVGRRRAGHQGLRRRGGPGAAARGRGRGRLRRVDGRRHDARSRFLPALELLPNIGLIAVLGYGGHQVLNGDLSLGTLLMFNVYIAMLVWPLRMLGMIVAQAQRAAVSAERVDEVLSTEPAVDDPAHPVSLPAGEPAARSRFEGVRFGYGCGHAGARRLRPARRARASRWRSSAPPARARRRSPASSRASTTSRTGAVRLDGVDVRGVRPDRAAAGGRHRVRGHVPLQRHDRRQHRLRRPRRPAGRDRARRPPGRRPRLHRGPGRGVRHPRSASGASRCRAGSASASPSPGRSWPTPGCSSSTTPPRRSTRRRSTRSATPSPRSCGAGPPSSSPTGPPRSPWPTGSC